MGKTTTTTTTTSSSSSVTTATWAKKDNEIGNAGTTPVFPSKAASLPQPFTSSVRKTKVEETFEKLSLLLQRIGLSLCPPPILLAILSSIIRETTTRRKKKSIFE